MWMRVARAAEFLPKRAATWTGGSRFLFLCFPPTTVAKNERPRYKVSCSLLAVCLTVPMSRPSLSLARGFPSHSPLFPSSLFPTCSHVPSHHLSLFLAKLLSNVILFFCDLATSGSSSP